jgi:glycosyltransferase involved in cell wall biosynthesis
MTSEIGGGYDITVVLPHFACPSLLDRAIASVATQTCPRWCLVIVDDDSPDLEAVLEVRQRWHGDRFVWLRTSTNVGQFRISNRLLPRIVSPFVVFQDADDWSAPDRFERLLSAVEEWRCDLVGSTMAVGPADAPVSIVRPPFDVNKALRARHRGGACWDRRCCAARRSFVCSAASMAPPGSARTRIWSIVRCLRDRSAITRSRSTTTSNDPIRSRTPRAPGSAAPSGARI